ncbi:hypothetical protein D1872_296800 [compost metagenome]
MYNKTFLSFILSRCWNTLSHEDRNALIGHIFDSLSIDKQRELIGDLINHEDDIWKVCEKIESEEIEKYRQYIK